ncbi:MAG: Chaperone protein ClpB [Chloroflexi bacterium ADurb.Bin360]|nr:MAG: Chaperone protein ClpB [Chloroflexi bacterium ADurb.Bin360]
MSRKLNAELRRLFRPEFLNRVDAVIVFRPLNRVALREIVRLEIEKVRTRVLENGLDLELTPAGQDWLCEQGYSEEYGARPLRRLVQQEVETPLSEALLSGEFHPGDVIALDAGEVGLFLRRVEPEPAPLAEH